MKKLLLILLLLIANHIFALMIVSLHPYGYFNKTDKTRSIRSTVSMPARQRIGFSFTRTSFSLENNKWGESLKGRFNLPSLSPAKQIGVGAMESQCFG